MPRHRNVDRDTAHCGEIGTAVTRQLRGFKLLNALSVVKTRQRLTGQRRNDDREKSQLGEKRERRLKKNFDRKLSLVQQQNEALSIIIVFASLPTNGYHRILIKMACVRCQSAGTHQRTILVKIATNAGCQSPLNFLMEIVLFGSLTNQKYTEHNETL